MVDGGDGNGGGGVATITTTTTTSTTTLEQGYIDSIADISCTDIADIAGWVVGVVVVVVPPGWWR